MSNYRWQAKQRHSAAMKEVINFMTTCRVNVLQSHDLCLLFQLSTNQLRELEVAQHPVMARKRALDVEKERAKHVSINKPLPTQPLIKVRTVSKINF